MFVQRRIHQDQLQHVAKMMRSLCAGKKELRGNPCSGNRRMGEIRISDQELNAAHQTDDPAFQKISPPETGRKRSEKKKTASNSGIGDPGLICLHCGVRFPQLDFHYTEQTGLCISCWELESPPCQ